MPYSAALAGCGRELEKIEPSVLRIESPGRDFRLEQALLLRGNRFGVERRYSSYPANIISTLRRDPGKFYATRQWYLGWRDWLEEIGRCAQTYGHQFFNAPAEIAVMFDKIACHQRLHAAKVSVPERLPEPEGLDSLIAAMEQSGRKRVFLKPSHGSGGSGVVAFALNKTAMCATTALTMAGGGVESTLYTTSKLRVYREPKEVKRLIDTVCRERLQVEAWIPKAGINGRCFDIRVVVIAGRSCHFSLRLADGPITNLHLGAAKGAEGLLGPHPACAEMVRDVAEKAAACFPHSLVCGVDVAVDTTYKRAYILELNAFGDLLPGILWRSADTYTAIAQAARKKAWSAEPTKAPEHDVIAGHGFPSDRD